MTAAIVALVQFSSSHQDAAAPPPRGNAHGATSALIVLSGRQKRVWPGLKNRLCDVICHVHIYTT